MEWWRVRVCGEVEGGGREAPMNKEKIAPLARHGEWVVVGAEDCAEGRGPCVRPPRVKSPGLCSTTAADVVGFGHLARTG